METTSSSTHSTAWACLAPSPNTGGVLVAFNVTFNSGGGGVHIFKSENVIAANNSCFNSYLDPYDQSATRACIDTNDSYSNTIINNIAVAYPAAPNGSCTFGVAPFQQFASAMLGGVPSGLPGSTWTNNITQLRGSQNSCWGAFGQNAAYRRKPDVERRRIFVRFEQMRD